MQSPFAPAIEMDQTGIQITFVEKPAPLQVYQDGYLSGLEFDFRTKNKHDHVVWLMEGMSGFHGQIWATSVDPDNVKEYTVFQRMPEYHLDSFTSGKPDNRLHVHFQMDRSPDRVRLLDTMIAAPPGKYHLHVRMEVRGRKDGHVYKLGEGKSQVITVVEPPRFSDGS